MAKKTPLACLADRTHPTMVGQDAEHSCGKSAVAFCGSLGEVCELHEELHRTWGHCQPAWHHDIKERTKRYVPKAPWVQA